MSDYGLFEADHDAEQAPRRKQRVAARKMTAALREIHAKFGDFLSNADGPDNFEDRWMMSKKDIIRVLTSSEVGAYPAVVREVYGSLKSAWYSKHSLENKDDRGDSPTKPPKDGGDKDRTINPGQFKKIKDGDKSVGDEVKTNSGDGSDAEGRKKDSRRRQADGGGLGGAWGDPGVAGVGGGTTGPGGTFGPAPGPGPDAGTTPIDGTGGSTEYLGHVHTRRTAEDRDAPLLTPEVNFDAYLDDVDQGGPEKVDAHDFTGGGDTGSDSPHREAMQLVADLYVDWAADNRLRHASMNTLDLYASNGLHDQDYYLLAGLIRRAECDCDDDEDKDDSDGPPPPSHDSEDSDDGSSDDSSDSEDGGESDSDGGSDSSSEESDSGDNPFAASDDTGSDEADDDGAEPADDNPFGDSGGPPAEDAPAPGGEVPPGDDGGFPGDPGGDPSAAGAPGDVGGQDFTVPEQAPELPPEMQQQIPQDDMQGAEPIPPEIIDQILGLPEGTIEQLVAQELGGGPQGPSPDQGGPPPQLARRRRAGEEKGQGGNPNSRDLPVRNEQDRRDRDRDYAFEDALNDKQARRRRAAEDPTQAAGADPAAAAQPQAPAQMPAAPPAGAGSAGTMAPPGSASVAPPPPAAPLENQPAEDALLDTAVQSVTQMIDQETQEYQQIIDPLTQALQAIQFAQQVEQAENPLDVTPPEGTTDVNPSAAPGGQQALQQQAYRIAKRYRLSQEGYGMLLEAMSRKHYEHVGEAIRTLPPELRGGIANHIGGMFSEDNPRFNHDKWMASVGVTARRRQAGDADAGLDSEHRDDNGACTQCGYHSGHSEDCKWSHTASRRPFVIDSRLRGGGRRTAGETWKNTPTMDAFEFPGQGEKPEITDNMKVNDLPKMKGAGLDHEAKGVLDMFDEFTKKRTDTGLNQGPEVNMDAFVQEQGPKVGPKAVNKLKKTISTGRRQASFFTRRVPGWKWDDHLAGYISKEARDFTCSCGNQIPTPSYGVCRCGRTWNSYAIGDGQHLSSNSADMFITREIPIRDDVIVANRHLAEDGYTAPSDHDVDWVEDEDREDADAPHAPGKTASRRQACWPGCHEDEAHAKKFHKDDDEGTEKSARVTLAWDAARYAGSGLVGERVSRRDNPGFQGVITHVDPQRVTAWVKHAGGHHEMNIRDLAGSGGFAAGRSAHRFFDAGWADEASDGWTKYDTPDPARADGPKKPPSTTIKGGDPHWHSREPEGKFKSTSPFRG